MVLARWMALACMVVTLQTSFAADGETPKLSHSVLMTGLNSPWDLAFLPDGSMLFTEKCHGLSIRFKDGKVSKLFGKEGYALLAKDLFCEGQSGVHGVAIDPEFDKNRYIYVYLASNLNKNPRTNRVARLTLAKDSKSVSERTDIVTDIPYEDAKNAYGAPGSHSGGRIRFGSDGFLYVTTGDNHNAPLPQGLNNLGGKVLRLTRAGKAAPGNNTPKGGDPRIFTYGHRNVQGISFRPGTGQPYVAEHGPGHSDEVTALVAGKNAGWDPRPEKGVSCPDDYCGYGSNKKDGTPTSMTDLAKFPDAMPAVWNNKGESDGYGPAEFLRGKQWKSWDGGFAIGVMASQRMDVVTLTPEGKFASVATASLPSARMRSLVQGPDGNLYIAVDGGAIWKIIPR